MGDVILAEYKVDYIIVEHTVYIYHLVGIKTGKDSESSVFM